MTPLALATLYAVLVCSIFGTVSETTADHETRSPALTFLDIIDKNNKVFNDANEAFPLVMKNHRTNFNMKHDIYNNNVNIEKNVNKNDDIYTADDENRNVINNNLFKDNVGKMRQYNMGVRDRNMTVKRVKREDDESVCAGFTYIPGSKRISHPTGSNGSTYRSSTDCETVIDATSMPGNTISLDFVDIFHIEDHPTCEYDYLEIRDGKFGYANLLNRYCGEKFPRNIKSSGPYLYLKFHSDATIEYEGFHINVKFEVNSQIKTIPKECYINETGESHGSIDSSKIPAECKANSAQNGLDVLWTIEVAPNHKIYLNFTDFKLERPNECTENYIEVFGAKPDIDNRFEKFCGSMANSVITKDAVGNRIYVHLYTSNRATNTHFNSVYTAFRILDPGKESCEDDEFNCEDNTCISLALRCDKYAHCRLKADEDEELCRGETESLISKPHIMVILVIFSLILSGMSFVFLFKCIRKLVQDHKIIKEHIRQSCEDRLYGLDARKLTRDSSEPRASLERENHTNEMYKKQRSHSHHKSPSSIDSDYVQETRLDLEEEEWRRDAGFSAEFETDEIRIEQNGKKRRSDVSRKEESIRRKEKIIEEDVKEKKEIKDASVGVPDTKESGCQTRESLFVTTGSSSGTDSGSNGQAFSTFGYSGATLVRPSPVPIEASHITIELLKTCPSQDTKAKKLPDRRPMSNETTRSAPDVIIVSKPIR